MTERPTCESVGDWRSPAKAFFCSSGSCSCKHHLALIRAGSSSSCFTVNVPRTHCPISLLKRSWPSPDGASRFVAQRRLFLESSRLGFLG